MLQNPKCNFRINVYKPEAQTEFDSIFYTFLVVKMSESMSEELRTINIYHIWGCKYKYSKLLNYRSL